ncbi:hypothetical protein SVA_1060 [Sulfurifustis variabilis]|uniref:Uncharacterized protein n=1 Tax=Sulfurifustis variabilis TaxID=1675686 RepID=A0A1B4V298_9GAMM|nr:hypothetical protein [Sulfurifustis variabilis]BAU47639.1 hypothetical protein SVA_1060 [Sulfurifustis variabilis]
MTKWQRVAAAGVVPGILAGAATSIVAAVRGRLDSGSALAPINAPSHVLWGDRAAAVRKPTWRHTALDYLINTAAGVFWASVLYRLFGRVIERGGAGAALAGGAATAGIAYLTDYRLVPGRLTPGYEKRVSGRSLFLIYGALALALAAGARIGGRAR